MLRGLLVTATLLGLAGIAVAQKPRAQNHHAKAAEHKNAPVALPKGGGGANGTDAQLKRLEQQTAKTAGANPQKQKAVAPLKVKAEPAAAHKNPPIAFKGQHPQGGQGGKAAVQKNALHARH